MSGKQTGASKRGSKGGEKSVSSWPFFLMAHDAMVWRIEERLKSEGLPEMNWYVVLWVLESAPEKRLRMNELAERAVLSRSNVTRLADRMEKAGLVERERVDGDRRGTYVRITKAGEAMKTRMWSVYGPAVQELFIRQMSKEEGMLLRDLMQRLHANAMNASGAGP